MTRWLRAALLRLLSILTLTLLIFGASRALVRALPGSPAETLLAESGTSLPLEAINDQLHLDEPFVPALGRDLLALLRHGDLGRSLITREKIAPLLGRRLIKTAELAGAAAALALALSLLIGLLAARHPGGRADRLCDLHSALAAAVPTPWLGPLLILCFAIYLPLFPVGDHLALPALCLGATIAGLWARLIRARVSESLEAGPAVCARARGIPEYRVLLKYGLAPVAGPLVAYLGTQLGGLLAGAFVTETVFDWRGMGSLLVEGVLRRDYPVVESAIFVTAAATLIGTALGDWAQRFVDPRLDEDGS